MSYLCYVCGEKANKKLGISLHHMVILHDDAYYESRKPQPDLGPLGNFKRFVWNKERRAFLDRTAKEWGQLGVFYLCFYTVLGSIFAIQMKISIDYVSRLDRPFFQYAGVSHKYLLRSLPIFHSSRLGSPGIVFKPDSISAASPIISVSNLTSSSRPKRHIQALTHFLKEYEKEKSKYNINCQNENIEDYGKGKPCFFDINDLGECSRPPYGYAKPLQPCVLIKFNKRFDWVPRYYNQSSSTPADMPAGLKKLIQRSTKPHVWLSCDGANNVDKEHIGDVEYTPLPGFPVEYFPFTGQRDYLSPIVALQFKNLTPGRLITVECHLWAFNIEQRSRHSLDFQIMIVDGPGTEQFNEWNFFYLIEATLMTNARILYKEYIVLAIFIILFACKRISK